MYIFYLCLRYLRTRCIAFVSIICVLLGVATMIVVNSVMSGFTAEMQARIHGILGDIIIEGFSGDGFQDAEGVMQKIRSVLDNDIEAMTPLCATAGIMNYRSGGLWVTKEVIIVGIDENTKGSVGDFNEYLQHPENRKALDFSLREGGYDVDDHQAQTKRSPDDEPERPEMAQAGWEFRRDYYSIYGMGGASFESGVQPALEDDSFDATMEEGSSEMFRIPPAPEPYDSTPAAPAEEGVADPFGEPIHEFDPQKEQHPGGVVGISLVMDRSGSVSYFYLLPGQDFRLTFATVSRPDKAPQAVTAHFTCVDLYESKMSEYDSRFVFVPLKRLQELRGMADPYDARLNRVNQIQIKLKAGVNLDAAVEKLRESKVLDPARFMCRSWRENQIVLLQAVEVEIAILNILLFMIIAVSGFGILAIFFMIVAEKTRDIGVLKALGASSNGIMSIFLMYGLLLGVVGAGLGMLTGFVFVWNINEIAQWLSWMMGRKIFDPDIYYFYQVPYQICPWTVGWIVGGAVFIAILASILPAWRAASLQPVDSLKYE
ncbi:MAG: FtsX-like permease family protein [Planctomycetia bacterium]|nr:FtsX-like permease family protein [Planctomycetia bacterium]